MTVFKTVLKILNKLKGMLILYTVMLVSITALNQSVADKDSPNFSESKPEILIVNKDNNYISNNFVEYLNKHAKVKNDKIDITSEEEINDAIFYREVNYVIYIPSSFCDSILNGKKPTLEYKSTNDERASYAEMLVNKWMKVLNVYKDYYQGEELISKVNESVDIDTNIEIKTKLETNKLYSMTRYFNFLNYALLAGCVYSISMILASIKENKVKKRTIISSYNYKKYNRIILLSNSIVIFSMWLFYMILAVIIFKDLMWSNNGILYIINSFVYSFLSLTIGFLIGNITQNKNAIGGIINVVALGTSFLCGCFVPFEYMPDYVINIAKCLPTYYFVDNNELIKVLEVINIENLKPIIINGVVILGFSILFIIITNYINKKKQIIN